MSQYYFSSVFISWQHNRGTVCRALSPASATIRATIVSAFHHVSPCFFSRDASPDESEQDYVGRLIKEYEDMFTRLGPETVAAVIVEPVGGATLGAVPAASGYLAQLRDLCDQYGALLIFDEVMCRMGRVGTLHAWQSLGSSAPDIQTIGKGLGAGYQPISGILISPEVHDAIKSSQATDPFINGHTYQGHSIACAAALATQRTIVKNNLLSNVRQMGDLLFRKLKTLTPHLKEVRGLGLFLAVGFSSEHTAHIAAKVAQACFKNGAAVYLCSAAVDAVMFAPPFIINEAEINELVEIFLGSVNEVMERKG